MLWSVQREFAETSSAAAGRHVLYAGRLSHQKGVADAIVACREAGLPLVVAGDGPDAAELQALAAGADVRFTGRVDAAELAELRRDAAVARRPLALRGDPPARGARSDGRGPPDRRGTIRRP